MEVEREEHISHLRQSGSGVGLQGATLLALEQRAPKQKK
jgi:hypothetical protein